VRYKRKAKFPTTQSCAALTVGSYSTAAPLTL